MLTLTPTTKSHNSSVFKQLQGGGKKKRAWWPVPPKGHGRQPLRQALWWVEVVGSEIARNCQHMQGLLESPTYDAQELARARSVLAADRCLFEFWLIRARKLEAVFGAQPEYAQDTLRGVQARLLALRQGWVGSVDPERVGQFVVAAQGTTVQAQVEAVPRGRVRVTAPR